MDEWHTIPGFPGYEITRSGRVRSIRDGRELKPWRAKDGRLLVNPVRGTNRSAVAVHRLMLFAFVGEPDGDQVAGFVNDEPADLRLENLVWRSRRGGV